MIIRGFCRRIRQKGYLMVGYSLLKALGWQNAIVLERLITEYNHAIKYGLLYKDYFSISVIHIAFYIGFSEEQVIEAINSLIDLNLIKTKLIKEQLYGIFIDEDEIIDFEKTKEIENQYKQWNYQLYTMQESGCLFMEDEESNGKN